MKKNTFCLAFLVSFLISCEQSHFNKFERIDKNEWNLNDTISFEFDITESDVYSIYLQLRHTKEYGYNNLWVKLIQDFPGENMDTTYLYQSSLAHPLSGKWLGECTSTYCTIEAPIVKNISLSETGNYKISIVQYMRQNLVEEISDIGIKVEKGVRP